MEKTFITAQDLLNMSFELNIKILKSGFKPKFIVAVWRGGTPVGIAIQEVMDYYGVKTDHISIRTSSYVGMQQQKEVHVHGLEYIINNINSEDSLLIIDDVFDSGRSIEALLRELRHTCRKNTPEIVKTATVYYKPNKNVTDLVPDFHLKETDDWLVFPHELVGCTEDEIKNSKGIDFPELNLK